jgi:hypothetical protein
VLLVTLAKRVVTFDFSIVVDMVGLRIGSVWVVEFFVMLLVILFAILFILSFIAAFF